MEDIAQLPIAPDEGGGQARAVGAGDAHALQVHADQLVGPHLLGQRRGHVVPVAAIQVRDAVNDVGPQGGEAGGGGQQVVLDFAVGDVVQRQLPGLEAPLLHRDQTQPDGGSTEGVLVQHPLHDLFQRGDIHAALPHHVPQKGVEF